MSPTLLVAAHGTRSAEGVATVQQLVSQVRTLRPQLSVQVGFLDVCAPTLAEAIDGLRAPAVVVPLLLASGYHVRTDIPAVTAGRPVTVARPIGPDPALTGLLVSRLAAVDGAGADRVVVAASPSSHPSAAADIRSVAADLAERLGRPVEACPIGPELATQLRAFAAEGRLAICSYLLAPGEFANRLRAAAPPGVPVAEPLGADPIVADVVLRRYDEVTAENVTGSLR